MSAQPDPDAARPAVTPLDAFRGPIARTKTGPLYTAGLAIVAFAMVVVDGKEGPEFEDTGAGSLRFSPDSRRVAYTARRGGKLRVVVDGQEGTEYDGIGPGFPEFSPDSRHVAYAAARGRKCLVVVDGKESQEYETVSPLVFDGPKRIRFVAIRYDESFNREMVRVEVAIVEEQP